MECPCSTVFFDVNQYICHLEYVHKMTSFTCTIDSCRRSFHKRHVFKNHIKTKHLFEHNPKTNVKRNLNLDVFENESDDPVPKSPKRQVESTEQKNNLTFESVKSKFISLLHQSVQTIVCKLYSDYTLPRSVIQSIITLFNSFLSGGIIESLNEILDLVENDVSVMKDLRTVLNKLENPFLSVNTEYKRITFFESSEKFIKPDQHIIGVSQDESNKNYTVTLTLKNRTLSFVSMKKQLQLFLDIPGVLANILKFQTKINNSNKLILSNITHGNLWRSKTHIQDKLVLPIVIYFDDFEVGNPLGSHAGVHKMGAIYYTIANIPPEYASRLENIFVAQLFYSLDRTQFGNKLTFDRLTQELKFLKNEGITVKSLNKQIYFEVALVIGDNLGIHSVLGFHESFSSNYFCRFCIGEKKDLKTQVTENINLIRDRKYYMDHLNNKSFGIKEYCVFHDLKYFHVYENLTCDIMYDLYEGVHRYDVALIIQNLIQENYFSLDILNYRIKYNQYEVFEKNKPTLLKLDHIKQGCIIMSASEMLCFVRNFKFIVGDLIPEDNKVWGFYLNILEITEIINSEMISHDSIVLLEQLIIEHNKMYQDFFKQELKPKHHFLLHYPRIIRQIGPPKHVSSMRFEGKHKDLKTNAFVARNRKNLPLTLTTSIQLKCCYRYISGTGFKDDIEMGPSISENVFDLNILEGWENNSDDYIFITWYQKNSVMYVPSCILQCGVEDDMPNFAKVKLIFVNKNDTSKCFFVCEALYTKSYSLHYCAYEVESAKNNIVLNTSDLDSIFPTIIHVLNNGTSMVALPKC